MLSPKHVLKLFIVICTFSSMMAFADESPSEETEVVINSGVKIS